MQLGTVINIQLTNEKVNKKEEKKTEIMLWESANYGNNSEGWESE